jgi:hypothetical protein
MHIAKGGHREDLKQYFRSKMEANMARYYRYIGELYIYEYKEFEFKGIKRGCRFYKPDFYLPVWDGWVEVKGWLRSADKTKLRRFKKYYPEEFAKLRFIIEDKYSGSKANGEMIKFLCDDLGIDFKEITSYKDMEEYRALIPGWE